MIKRGSVVLVKQISYEKNEALLGPRERGYLDDYIGERVVVTNRKNKDGFVEVLCNIEHMCDAKILLREDIEDTGEVIEL